MNSITLAGKVSRVKALKYTPSGVATIQFTLAVCQKLLDKGSMGYFEVLVFGELAENKAKMIKIGKEVSVTGQLWGRTYRNRQGLRLTETKVIAEDFEIIERS